MSILEDTTQNYCTLLGSPRVGTALPLTFLRSQLSARNLINVPDLQPQYGVRKVPLGPSLPRTLGVLATSLNTQPCAWCGDQGVEGWKSGFPMCDGLQPCTCVQGQRWALRGLASDGDLFRIQG